MELLEENQRLKREIQALQEKLAVYEDASNEKEGEEKKRVESIFRMFDTDSSGDIDAKELQQLAFQLGETLTTEEAEEALRHIDTNKDGIISFDDFYAWWRSVEHTDKEEGPTSAQHTASSTRNLRILQMKLRSRSYMRAVSRLVEKVNQKAGFSSADRKEGEASKRSKGKEKEKEKEIEKEKAKEGELADEVFNVNVKALVGNFDDTACSAHLSYFFDEPKAAAFRKECGAHDNATLLALSFVVKPEVDDFELGELSGNIKDILLMVKDSAYLTTHRVQVKEEDGHKLLQVSVVFQENEKLEITTGMITAFQIRQLEGDLELSQSPTQPDEDDFLKLRARVQAIVGTAAVDFVKALAGESEDPTSRAAPTDAIALLTALRNLDLTLKFDDLADMYKQAFKDTMAAGLKGWASGRELLKPALKELLGDKEVPPVLAAYNCAKDNLIGLHSLRVQFGDNVFLATARNLDVISFLPKATEMGLND